MEGLVILIIISMGLIVGLLITKRELARKNWPTTNAYVTSAKVIQDYGSTQGFNPNTAMRMGLLGLAYSIELSYSFEVSGQKHDGKSIKLETDKRISKEQAEKRMNDFYKPGSKIQVFYNPQDPEDSKLDKGNIGWGLLIIVWTLIFAVVIIGSSFVK